MCWCNTSNQPSFCFWESQFSINLWIEFATVFRSIMFVLMILCMFVRSNGNYADNSGFNSRRWVDAFHAHLFKTIKSLIYFILQKEPHAYAKLIFVSYCNEYGLRINSGAWCWHCLNVFLHFPSKRKSFSSISIGYRLKICWIECHRASKYGCDYLSKVS